MEISLKDLKDKKVHFIGIGGISMSALAFVLKKNKIYVQGSDLADNLEVDKLKKAGIKVFDFHSEKNLKDIDVVVYTSAILKDNPELAFAKNNGLIVLKRAELWGIIMQAYKLVIAVAGSHGKTTTTAMLAEVFEKANLKPTFHIGGNLKSVKSNYKIGNKKYFILEACEYKDNYLYFKPDLEIILNIDGDHLDYFKDLNGVKSSFIKFKNNLKHGGLCVICNDDENSKCLKTDENYATFGFCKTADIYAVNIKEYKPCCYSFDVVFSKCKLGNIKLNILGKHNILNALAVIVAAMCCAVDFCDIKTALESFSGVKRRCEKVGEINGAEVYHDYAHHPEQIAKMIEVGKNLTKRSKGRVIVVFEPHTYSRTKFLINEFAECFSGADKVILAPVYSAREKPTEGFDSLKLASEVKRFNKDVEYLESYKEIYDRLKVVVNSRDVVLILGAGSIEKLGDFVACNT